MNYDIQSVERVFVENKKYFPDLATNHIVLKLEHYLVAFSSAISLFCLVSPTFQNQGFKLASTTNRTDHSLLTLTSVTDRGYVHASAV